MTAAMASRRLFGEVTRWQQYQLEKLQIDIRLGEQATPETILALSPEAVVIAAGSRPAKDGYSSLRPDVLKIPGANQENVFMVWDVFEHPESLGRNVILVADDPHLTGAYVAEHLAEKGRHVRLVTSQLNPVSDLNVKLAPEVIQRLRAKDVEIHTSRLLNEIAGSSAKFKDRFSERYETFEGFDSLVLSTRNLAEDSLVQPLKATGIEIFSVGDSVAPRRVEDAIIDGERAGWMI